MIENLELVAPDTSPHVEQGRDDVDISVVVPVIDRPEPLDQLYREYSLPLREAGYRFEFVFVAEPWFDHLLQPAAALAAMGEPVRVLNG